jgi:hypothetical protein
MFDEGGKHTVAGIGVARAANGASWATLDAVNDKTLPKAASAKPSPGRPVFAKDDPCGRSVDAAAIGGETVVRLSSANSNGGRVSMRATSLPSWASFTSKAGTKAAGTLTAKPGVGDWLQDAIGASRTATIVAKNAPGVTTTCVVTFPVTLL